MWGSAFILLVAGLSQVLADVEIIDQSAVESGGQLGNIVGGAPAKDHEFPWQAYLIVAHPASLSYCGGSLIAPQWILSAAHCVDSYKPIDYVRVIVGNIKRGYTEDTAQNQITKNFALHPGYIIKNATNDISVIKVPMPFKLNEYVQVIRLPSLSQKGESFVGREVAMSGFGFTSDRKKERADVLMAVRSTVFDQKKCYQRYLGVSGLRLRDTQICVDTSNGKGICNGDSGGPMVLYEGGTPTLIGITSFTVTTGCEVGFPSVFTRVTEYLDWIHEKTNIPLRP